MPCPCHSSLSYEKCCKSFHDKKEIPKRPLELMRSRYAAYALNIPSYIMETTYSKSKHFSSNTDVWKKEIELFSTQFDFVGLTILSEEEGFPIAYVTFKAHLEQNGEDHSFKERSRFVSENGKWFFD